MKMIVYSTEGEPKEIEGEDIGFEVHGKKFIVHKTPKFVFGGPVSLKYKWSVTETSTGFGVCKGATKKDVIERTREMLKKVSAEEMEVACAKAKKTLSAALRNLKRMAE